MTSVTSSEEGISVVVGLSVRSLSVDGTVTVIGELVEVVVNGLEVVGTASSVVACDSVVLSIGKSVVAGESSSSVIVVDVSTGGAWVVIASSIL